MHPRIRELLDHLAHYRAELRSAVDSIPREKLEKKPAPDRWSVAEVLEHLSIVEGRVCDRFNQALAAAEAEGLSKDSETASVLPSVDMSRLLDRSRKVTAPDVLIPRAGLTADAAWSSLEASRARFLDALRAADGLALGTITMQHPALGELTLYQWIGSVAGHEARHTAQIREIGRSL